MIYGIRRDLQQQVHDAGNILQVYVPFGTDWCPYFMRRLSERPANCWFVLRSLIGRVRHTKFRSGAPNLSHESNASSAIVRVDCFNRADHESRRGKVSQSVTSKSTVRLGAWLLAPSTACTTRR